MESSKLSTKLGLQSYHCCSAAFLGWNPILEHAAHIMQNLEITQLFWCFFKVNQISLHCSGVSHCVGRSIPGNMALMQPREIRCLEQGWDSFMLEKQNKVQDIQSHSKQVQLRTWSYASAKIALLVFNEKLLPEWAQTRPVTNHVTLAA